MDRDRFYQCPCCQAWFSSQDILDSPQVEPLGMTFDQDDTGFNLLYFNHVEPGCGSTFTIEAQRLRDVPVGDAAAGGDGRSGRMRAPLHVDGRPERVPGRLPLGTLPPLPAAVAGTARPRRPSETNARTSRPTLRAATVVPARRASASTIADVRVPHQFLEDLPQRLHLLAEPDRLPRHQRALLDVRRRRPPRAGCRPRSARPRTAPPGGRSRRPELLAAARAAVRRRSPSPGCASARTATTGSLLLYCGVEIASRARALMKTSLNRGCARHSSAITKRVPIWAPAAPIRPRCAIMLAGADAAGDEDRHLLVELEQDLLQQHDRRDVADVAARLAALEDERVGPVVDHAPGDGVGARRSRAPRAAGLGLRRPRSRAGSSRRRRCG